MIPHMITSGCLRASPQKREWPISADQEEAARGGLQLKPECWWLIRRHVAAPSGASSLLAFLPFSLYTHTLSLAQTHPHTHSMFPPLISPRNESPPLLPHNRFLPFSPLFISSQSFIWEMESEQLPTLTCCSSGDVYIKRGAVKRGERRENPGEKGGQSRGWLRGEKSKNEGLRGKRSGGERIKRHASYYRQLSLFFPPHHRCFLHNLI